MTEFRTKAFAPTLLSVLLAIACSDAGDADLVGSAQIAITNVPSDVSCIQVAASAPSRSVVRRFDVVPGQSSVLNLEQLPTGNVSFSGSAYQQTCAAVTASSNALWLSEPVVTDVPQSGEPANLTLVMRRNGQATVSVDFEEDGQGGASGSGGSSGSGGTTGSACGNGIVESGEFCFASQISTPTNARGIRAIAAGRAALSGPVEVFASAELQNQIMRFHLTPSGSLLNVGTLPAPGGMDELQVSDVDQNGLLDVLVDGNAGVFLLRNQGGGFGSQELVVSAPDTIDFAVGSFDGDAFPDLFVIRDLPPRISVFVNSGSGQFTNQFSAPLSATPAAIAVGAFSGAGLSDAAVTFQGSQQMQLLTNTGGTLNVGSTQPFLPFTELDSSDLNSDGMPDILGAIQNPPRYAVALSAGTNFPSTGRHEFPSLDAVAVGAADANGDGIPDIIAANSDGLFQVRFSAP